MLSYCMKVTFCIITGERILEFLERAQLPVTPWHVQLLVRLGVRRLSVSGSVVFAGILETSSAQHLQELLLFYGGCGDRAVKMYDFLNTSTNLTYLCCTDFCNNTMLQIIADTCRHLHCLELHACDVTNEGVLKLCGLNQDLRESIEMLSKGETIHPTSLCSQSLKQIKLTMTKVTEAGVAIILLVLPGIQLLRVPDIQMNQLFNFLQTVDHKNIQSSLLEFHSREILDEFQLNVLTTLCPNLEYIQVTFVGNVDMDIIRLESLSKLQKLRRAKLADVSSEALVWFLEKVGKNIEHLHLYTYHTKFSPEKLHITRRHLQSLARCCPSLRSLKIDGYCLDENEPPIQDSVKYFQELESLQLLSMRLTEDDLRVFLSQCKDIRALDLVLQNPYVLHDRLIIQFLNSGLWQNLTKVRILNSPITYKVLVQLVGECPLLQEVGCLYTWLISKQQVAEFKNKVTLENLDLEVY